TRAFDLCVLEGATLRDVAERQHRHRVALPPERGAIVDRHGDPLALTVESASVYLRPRAAAGGTLVPALARTVDLTPAVLTEKLSSPQRFVWLLRNATPEQAEAIAGLALTGVGTEAGRRRYYPRGTLAGQVLGFAGVDSQGLEGIELAYDHYLR